MRILTPLIAAVLTPTLAFATPIEPDLLNLASSSSPVEAHDAAVTGTPGDDQIDLASPVQASAILDTTDADAVKTTAIGIDAVGGDDQIHGSASLTADAQTTFNKALKLSSTQADADSTGIAAGAGQDTVTSDSLVESTSIVDMTIGELLMQIDVGVTGWPTESTAISTGIDGGGAPDTITTNDGVTVTADSFARVNKGRIGSVEIPIDVLGLGDARTTATSNAIGIRGGEEATAPSCSLSPGPCVETITHNGTLTVYAPSEATTREFIAELFGAARVDAATAAHSTGAGIVGSSWDNVIVNGGSIDVDAVSTAELRSAQLKMKGLMVKGAFDLFGFDVGETSTGAVARRRHDHQRSDGTDFRRLQRGECDLARAHHSDQPSDGFEWRELGTRGRERGPAHGDLCSLGLRRGHSRGGPLGVRRCRHHRLGDRYRNRGRGGSGHDHERLRTPVRGEVPRHVHGRQRRHLGRQEQQKSLPRCGDRRHEHPRGCFRDRDRRRERS
jgi:hypothetical protein